MPISHKPKPKPFLTIADVAEQLQVSQKTVHRWIGAKTLPVHRLGRQLRVSRNDLESFLASRRQGRSSYDL